MRTFAPLAESDLPVPTDLLDALVDAVGSTGHWVVIGATARDFALHLGRVDLPRRATNDVDIAVAAHDSIDFESKLAGVGRPAAAWQRRVLLGQQVDVIPFGGIERDGEVVVNESRLNVLGLSEAAVHADRLVLPSGRALPVAPLELIAILKFLAFSDRHPGETKDAQDLRVVLQAASRGVYGEEVWDDDVSMAATGFDHGLAGAHRLGRRGIECFAPHRASLLLKIVGSAEDSLRSTWRRDSHDLLDAWLSGLRQAPSDGSVGWPGGDHE